VDRHFRQFCRCTGYQNIVISALMPPSGSGMDGRRMAGSKS
jgi:hypothetical protein